MSKTFNLGKRIQLHRAFTWDMFSEAWASRPPKTADKKLNALRIFGVMILW